MLRKQSVVQKPASMSTPTDFIKIFEFKQDRRKRGRVLEWAKIGDVYMSRLTIDPGVVTGNYYRKKTRLMFYNAGGDVEVAFEHVKTGKKKRMRLEYGQHAIHVPPYVAIASKNVGHTPALLVFFSDNPIRLEGDRYPYHIMD